jgi:hypothetical protein
MADISSYEASSAPEVFRHAPDLTLTSFLDNP